MPSSDPQRTRHERDYTNPLRGALLICLIGAVLITLVVAAASLTTITWQDIADAF